MSEPTTDDELTILVREFLAKVREEADKREEHDVVDRVLAAATFVVAAVLIGWPVDKKVPDFFAALARLAKQIWNRKAWFLP